MKEDSPGTMEQPTPSGGHEWAVMGILRLLLFLSLSPVVDSPHPWIVSAMPTGLEGAVTSGSAGDPETRGVPPPISSASAWQALAQPDGTEALPGSQLLIVESGPVEPAVPLKLSLRVQVLVPARAIEIAATLSKRPGFPAHLFYDRNVTARITLPTGLQLQTGDLTWSGDLRGDQVVRFDATVGALHDTEGVVEATAIGYAVGGRVDADTVRFHVVVRGHHIGVGLEPLVTPERGPAPSVPHR